MVRIRHPHGYSDDQEGHLRAPEDFHNINDNDGHYQNDEQSNNKRHSFCRLPLPCCLISCPSDPGSSSIGFFNVDFIYSCSWRSDAQFLDVNFPNTFQTRFENEGVKRNYDAHWYDVKDEIEGSDVI